MTKLRKKHALIVIKLLLWLLPQTVWSATFYVSDGVEIQAALTTAESNAQDDLIQIEEGTYQIVSTLTYNSIENYALTIKGAGQSETIIDGGSAYQILTISTTQPNGDVIISDLTFQNGATSLNGGALAVSASSASISISNCEIRDSTATGNGSIGGGAHLQADIGEIDVTSCTFKQNRSSANVGGLFAGTDTGKIALHKSIFDSNTVSNSSEFLHYGDGGGAMLYSDGTSQIIVEENTFTKNSGTGDSTDSTPDGGGIMTYQLGALSTVSVENNSFIENQVQLGGGGCFSKFNVSGTATFKNNLFQGNKTIISNGGGAYLQFNDGDLVYSGNIHSGNQSAEDGGGAWINQIAGTAVLKENRFTSNQAINNGGGLVVATETAEISIYKNIFNANTSGGIGAGLSYAATEGQLDLHNNTFFENIASGVGGGLYLYFDQVHLEATLKNNILWNDKPNELSYSVGSVAGTVILTYSNIENGTQEPWFGTGCISSDPLFLNPQINDFRLGWKNYPQIDETRSPCIDSGDPGSPYDPDQSRADMGALAYDVDVDDPEATGGTNITAQLWAKAVLEVSGNPVTLQWQMVGADITPSGDQVISGYFYADPDDFAYGSLYNPELFVKIYIATNGWCNMAFNHVTVDDVSVYSMNGGESQSSSATLNTRLVEHQYNGVPIDDTLQTTWETAAATSSGGYTLSSGLWAKAILQPSTGAVNLIWKEVGTDITPSGDQVISGYFYADSNDFAYGSPYNPEVFVKVYIASNGWANMAFNHVTVDGVDISSAHNYAGVSDLSGTATLEGRLVEHQYDGVGLQ